MKCKQALLTTMILTIIACSRKSDEINWHYPKIESITKEYNYFGNKVTDPYSNLENLKDSNVINWFLEERIFHDSIISLISGKDSLLAEMKEYYNSTTIRGSLPRGVGNRLFFVRNFILLNKLQILYYIDSVNQEPVEIFSLEDMNKKDQVNYYIDYYEPSFDGKYLAFGISYSGDENSTLYILDVDAKKLLNEKIKHATGAGPHWLPDSRSFVYRKAKHINEVGKILNMEDTQICMHRIGTDPKSDKEIFSDAVTTSVNIDKIDFPRIYTFPQSGYVLGSISHGSTRFSNIYYTKADDILNKVPQKINWKRLCNDLEKISDFLLIGNKLVILSFDKNPNGSLEILSLEDPSERKVLMEGKNYVIDGMMLSRNALFVSIFDGGFNRLIRIDIKDYSQHEVSLPSKGTVYLSPSYAGSPYYFNSEDFVFGYMSWNKEWGAYMYDNDKDTVFRLDTRPLGKYGNPSNIEVKVVSVKSYDSTEVPITIIFNSDYKLKGDNPAILNAYGAYGESIKPFFNTIDLAWLNNGGIIVQAHVRGGGEKGEEWRKGGYKATKQNSWLDLIASAEYLINENYTSPEKLSVWGASAGGITVGRAITERPDLFNAAVIEVGVCNPLRFENSSNTNNTIEFGTNTDSLECQYLINMDTYIHIEEGKSYPAIIFTGGLNDNRVDAWQPGKAVAKLQNLKSQKNIVLFRVSEEGHFGEFSYEEYMSDMYAFLLWQSGDNEFKMKH